MTAREQLAHAKRLAKEAHAGQADRGGHPYVEHLSAVASWCESDVEKTVAWLHDILEDTSVDRKRLLEEGFSEEVVTAVELLTKRYYPGFDYREYLENIRRNPLACKVKLCDLRHNMDTSRLKSITEKDIIYQEKYRISRDYLNGTLEEGYEFPQVWSRHVEG